MNWGRMIRSNGVIVALGAVVAVLAIALMLLLLRDVDLSPQIRFAREHAALAGAIVALTSLVTVTFATWMNWRATRRQATLEAWTRWSDDTADDRKIISNLIGLQSLSPAQAQALVKGTPGTKPADGATRRWLQRRKLKRPKTVVGDVATFAPEDRRQLVHAAIAVLNGLERLAVGVELGVYKRNVLVEVGGTIIKRSFERFEPYIQLKRNDADPARRQEKAYVALEKLARQIRYNEVDAERLASLRRQP